MCRCCSRRRALRSPNGRVPVADGRTIWPPDERRPASRIYTIRSVDVAAGTLDIDFVRHGVGIASTVSPSNPREGARDRLRGPDRPQNSGCGFLSSRRRRDRHSGDGAHSGGRTRRAHAVSRLSRSTSAEERQPLDCGASIDVRWLYRNGAEAGTTTLLEDAREGHRAAEIRIRLCLGGRGNSRGARTRARIGATISRFSTEQNLARRVLEALSNACAYAAHAFARSKFCSEWRR